jgi:hypothetical protein
MKRARKLKVVAAEDLSGAAVDAEVMGVAAVAATAAIATGADTEAGVVALAAGNLVTRDFQALDAPIIRKGELLWLADQARLFKNAKRNSLGRKSRRIRLQSAPSGVRNKRRQDRGIWTMISITVWLTSPTRNCSK